MNGRVKKLMEESGYAAPDLAGRATKLVDLIIKECIIAVENTDTTHIYTTYDKGVVEETMRRSIDSIKSRLGITND